MLRLAATIKCFFKFDGDNDGGEVLGNLTLTTGISSSKAPSSMLPFLVCLYIIVRYVWPLSKQYIGSGNSVVWMQPINK